MLSYFSSRNFDKCNNCRSTTHNTTIELVLAVEIRKLHDFPAFFEKRTLMFFRFSFSPYVCFDSKHAVKETKSPWTRIINRRLLFHKLLTRWTMRRIVHNFDTFVHVWYLFQTCIFGKLLKFTILSENSLDN